MRQYTDYEIAERVTKGITKTFPGTYAFHVTDDQWEGKDGHWEDVRNAVSVGDNYGHSADILVINGLVGLFDRKNYRAVSVTEWDGPTKTMMRVSAMLSGWGLKLI